VTTPPSRSTQPLGQRIVRVLREELGEIRPIQHALDLASRTIPPKVGNHLRASLLRARGIAIGEGTVVYDTPELSGGEAAGRAKMYIGRHCIIDVRCAFELGANITIGDRVTLGHNVMIITTTHDLGPREHRAGPLVRNPVRIEDGAWIGPCSIILPGVTVGAGAIVDPSSVINKNVAPNTRVRGSPAKVVEELEP
jgi:maltose O-acetyltransferase